MELIQKLLLMIGDREVVIFDLRTEVAALQAKIAELEKKNGD